QNIRVGYRQTFSPFAVTNRPGLSSGACRSDPQSATGIDLGDRAADGANRGNVNEGNTDRHTVNLSFVSDTDSSFAERNVRGCPPHVKRDDVRIAALRRDVKRTHNPTGGSGHNGV